MVAPLFAVCYRTMSPSHAPRLVEIHEAAQTVPQNSSVSAFGNLFEATFDIMPIHGSMLCAFRMLQGRLRDVHHSQLRHMSSLCPAKLFIIKTSCIHQKLGVQVYPQCINDMTYRNQDKQGHFRIINVLWTLHRHDMNSRPQIRIIHIIWLWSERSHMDILMCGIECAQHTVSGEPAASVIAKRCHDATALRVGRRRTSGLRPAEGASLLFTIRRSSFWIADGSSVAPGE